MLSENVIDLDTFQELKDLMGEEFVLDLIDIYLEETGGQLEQLEEACRVGDAGALARIAHSMKSSSASLGALDFARQARELELTGKAGDLSGAGALAGGLSAGYPAVRSRLEELRNGH